MKQGLLLSLLALGLLFVLPACDAGGDDDDDDDTTPPAEEGVVLVVGKEGQLARVGLETPFAVEQGQATVPSPVSARFAGGFLYVVSGPPNEGVAVVDPDTLDIIRTISLPSGSDPQDVAVVDGIGYVSLAGSNAVAKLDVETGASLMTIDLSSFADGDGSAELRRVIVFEERLYVQMQREDSSGPGDPQDAPMLGVVDLTTDDVATPIALTGALPQHDMVMDASARRLYVSTPTSTFMETGGIEMVDVDEQTSLGFSISEVEVGAQIGGFALVSAERAWVINHTDIVQSSHLHVGARDPWVHLDAIFDTFDYGDELAFDATTSTLFYPDPCTDKLCPDGAALQVFDTSAEAFVSRVALGYGALDAVIAR